MSDLVRVLCFVEKHYARVGQLFGEGKQYGCHVVRGNVDEPDRINKLVLHGTVSETSGCKIYAPEKVDRLERHADHWSSFQSANPDKKQYGGAIRLPFEQSRIIRFMSWSSFSAKADEAFMLGTAVSLNLMTLDRAMHIAALSDNEVFRPMLDYFTAHR